MMGDRSFGDDVLFHSIVTKAATVSPAAFVVCPVPICACAPAAGRWMQDLYRLAYEQSKAVVLPPRHERLLLASFN